MPDSYIKDRIREGLRVPAHVWKAGLTGLTTAVPPSESGTITAPTVIIWGERDELLPLQDGYLLAAAIPGSRLIVYEDTGHLVLWEQPERVARDLADFVAGLSTSGQNALFLPEITSTALLYLLAVWVVVMSALRLRSAFAFGERVSVRWVPALLSLLGIFAGARVLIIPGAGMSALSLNLAIFAILSGLALIEYGIRESKEGSAKTHPESSV